MSDMGFGYYGTPEGEQTPNTQEQGTAPKWFRDKAEADSKAMKEMREELDRLRAERSQAQVADVLESKGYVRGAAAFYAGEPDKVEEWIAVNAASLARTDGTTGEAPKETAPAGPPASALSADSQAQMAAMAAAGADGAQQALSGDAATSAALAATRSPEEFQEVMRSHGWNYDITT